MIQNFTLTLNMTEDVDLHELLGVPRDYDWDKLTSTEQEIVVEHCREIIFRNDNLISVTKTE